MLGTVNKPALPEKIGVTGSSKQCSMLVIWPTVKLIATATSKKFSVTYFHLKAKNTKPKSFREDWNSY